MRLHRFYIEEKIAGKKEIKIFDETILHQMKSVFRLEKGDRVVLFDMGGKDFECEIKILSKKEGEFEVMAEKQAFIPEKKVTLYLALIKKDNFELASRMATEIGVSKIVPILTDRSEKKNIDLERLKRIVKEASEQCGRGDIPIIDLITNLELGITNAIQETSQVFVADFNGEPIRNLSFVIDNCSLFVGPEGGWSDSEREFFKQNNAKFISLGDTVLRAETATTVVSALIFNN